MTEDRLLFASREQFGAYRGRCSATRANSTKAHLLTERQMSAPIANIPEPFTASSRPKHREPMVLQQSLAQARWIAESDPRVAVIVAKRDLVVSVFVSSTHSLSGSWALGIRYMARSRSGMELLVSAVVDLFAGEILSLATFEPLTSSSATRRT